MKVRTILIFQLLIMVILSITTSGCNKDEAITKKDVVIEWEDPADIVYGTPLSLTQLNATTDVAGTFVYTPPIGTVLDTGEAQNLTVDFTPADGANYNPATKNVIINVIKNEVVIEWSNPADIFYGTELSEIQLNATTDIAGTFVYTPSIGTILGVGDSQNLTVEFIPDDITNYNAASKTVAINVKEITVTDYDGNVYHGVRIGSQIWMVENLKVTHYRNGDPILNVSDNSGWFNSTSGAYCWYDNDISNKETYGALYNWLAISDNRNVAPEGWHVPTDAEWTTLTTFLGGESVAGGKLKEIGLTHWQSPNTGADNSSGFTALPGGYRELDGDFQRLGLNPGWWSKTESSTDRTWIRYLGYDYSSITRYDEYKKYGLSVRCVKD